MENLVENKSVEYKTSVKKLKSDIKKLAEEQVVMRNQRKTVNLVGERTVDPSTATYIHQDNGHKLRIMYAAYGLARGNKFSVTENRYPEENHPLNEFKNEIYFVLTNYKLEDYI